MRQGSFSRHNALRLNAARPHGVGMEFDPMKLPWWKIAAAGGLACVATMGIIERRRSTELVPAHVDPGAPVVTTEGEAATPWHSATEIDEETAGVEPETLLPAKIYPVGRASDLEFAAAA